MSAPLSSLAPSAAVQGSAASPAMPTSPGSVGPVKATRVDISTVTVDECDDGHHHTKSGGNWAWAVIVFIILVIIIWCIIWLACPEWAQKTCKDGKSTGELDSGKALLWAIIISIVICVLISVFWWACW